MQKIGKTRPCRHYEKMTAKQLQSYAKKNDRIYSGILGKYQFVTQGNYLYATTNDISEDLHLLNAVDIGDKFNNFAMILDERNWDSVVDSYKKLDLPLTDDGYLVCQTDGGVGLFDPKLLKELSKFFVSKDLQVFQSVDDEASDNPTMFIGLVSRDRSEIGFLLSYGEVTVNNRDLAISLKDAVRTDLYDILEQRGISKDRAKNVSSIDIEIHGKRSYANVRLSILKQLPAEQIVSWGIKQSVFYTEHGRWVDHMALFACERLEHAVMNGFEDLDDLKRCLSYPYDAEDKITYDLDLSDYSGVLSEIADKIEKCAVSIDGYLKDCQYELERQLESDFDYNLLMKKDSINTERFRNVGISLKDFTQFVQNQDTWFPANESVRRNQRNRRYF